MTNITRIVKDYRDTGSLASVLALWGFVDENTFLTKSGAVGVVYRITGADVECLDHVERQAIARRFEQALRQLDESCRLYEYVIKRPADPITADAHPHEIVHAVLQRRVAHLSADADTLFEFDLYLVVVYESPTLHEQWGRRFGRRVTEAFSVRSTARSLDANLRQARATLHNRTLGFVTQLTDAVAPVLLGKQDAFRFFRHLLNYTSWKRDLPALKYDTHLDVYASDSTVECHRDCLRVDDVFVKVLTMKEPPAKTYAAMLQDLYAVPGPFVACLEWQRRPNATMRRDLQARRRHFFNKKVSLVNYLHSQTKPEEMLVDDAASATVHELGQGLTAMEVHGHFFGACSISIAVYDRDRSQLDRAVAACAKTFASHDGGLHDESYNLLNAWLALVPGNAANNLRRLALLNTNCADLSFLFTLHSGARTSAHLAGAEHLAVFETEHQTPYFWTLHHDDVGHVFIQGATGAGKSFLLNFIVTHVQKYDPVTVIFDLGGSYDSLVRRLGGSTWRIGLAHRDFTINPFCLPPTATHLHFLFSFVRVLLQGSEQYALTLHDDRDLYEAIENIYALDPPQRRLLTLSQLLPRALGDKLHRWIEGGPYARVFDNVEDTLTLQELQCFDFEGLERFPLVLEPLLFFVLHRTSAVVQDADQATRLKVFVLDEAWRFARDATVTAYLTEALKTWRKRNAAVLLATQSGEDFVATDLLRTVIESCPTKFFLANPNLDVSKARALFHLNETEATRITELRPRQQALLKRPDVSRVVNLHVDPESAALFTKTPLVTTERLHEQGGPPTRHCRSHSNTAIPKNCEGSAADSTHLASLRRPRRLWPKRELPSMPLKRTRQHLPQRRMACGFNATPSGPLSNVRLYSSAAI
jgi:type IV secretion system protein VirB4